MKIYKITEARGLTMKHNKKFTKVNYSKMSNKQNKYLVIHWVAAVSTAKNNADYFYSTYRGASAHYFVDGNSDINQAVWQIVGENDAAWHVGASKYYHAECRNTNSIGIEICCINKNGKVIMDPVAIERAFKLAKSIVDMWGIKRENILRHYDVTGKNCPAEFVASPERWNDFINKIYSTEKPVEPEKEDMEVTKLLEKYNVKTLQEFDQIVEKHCGTDFNGGFLKSERETNARLKAENDNLLTKNNDLSNKVNSLNNKITQLEKSTEQFQDAVVGQKEVIKEVNIVDLTKWAENGLTIEETKGNITTITNFKLKG